MFYKRCYQVTNKSWHQPTSKHRQPERIFRPTQIWERVLT